MKRFRPAFTHLFSLAFFVFSLLLPSRMQAQHAEVSFQVFYDELAPHGRWLIHPKHGDVWAPHVEGEFTPYLTNGYWTVTQYGNTWVSNYDWGWATFHYGRWSFDEFEGWIWIPDTTWAPAWVVWRNGGGYYGWAPMSPGLNFSISFNLFNDIPSSYWCFVPQQYVWRPYVYRYCSPRQRNVYIVNNTTYVTHYHGDTYNYYSGPSHSEITHATRRPVVINRIEQSNRPGRAEFDREKIIMYKPIVTRNSNDKPNTSRANVNDRESWFQDGKGSAKGSRNTEGSNVSNRDREINEETSESRGRGNSENNSRWNANSDNPGVYMNRDRNTTDSRSESNRSTNSTRYSTGTLNKSSNSASGWNANRGTNSGNTKTTSGGGHDESNRGYTPNRTVPTRNNSSTTPSRTPTTKSFSVPANKSSGSGNSGYSPSRSSSGQKSSSGGSSESKTSRTRQKN